LKNTLVRELFVFEEKEEQTTPLFAPDLLEWSFIALRNLVYPSTLMYVPLN